MKLPLNCEVEYVSSFLTSDESGELFSELKNLVEKENPSPPLVNHKTFEVSYKKIMFLNSELLEKNIFPEEIWGRTLTYTKKLEKLKEKIKSHTGQTFEVCVLIYYPDGNSGVDFHSDYPAFGDTSVIPSVSLGEERVFLLKEKESAVETSQLLENGSLIVMGPNCQENYEHSLPTSPEYKKPRINLTFRKYGY